MAELGQVQLSRLLVGVLKSSSLRRQKSAGGNTRLSYAYFCSDDCEATVDYIEAIRKLEGPRISKDDRDSSELLLLKTRRTTIGSKAWGAKSRNLRGHRVTRSFRPVPVIRNYQGLNRLESTA